MTSVEIKGLCKRYRGKNGALVRAVENLSLNIEHGEVFGFLGPNGAGKSTTIKAIMGLITPSEGSISLHGIALPNRAARQCVGFLPESPSFYDFLSAREYLRFVASVFNMEKTVAEQELRRVLELLDLSSAADRPIRGYSKGMVQRLGLAQALLHDPDIYILDEPMSGLDPLGRALVKDIIRDLGRRGKTVFFSTHITADVEVVCDRVGIIAEGRLRSVHEVDAILESGIEGYMVRVRNCPNFCGEGVEVKEKRDSMVEFYVERSAFDHFMSVVSASAGQIELIEPHRRNLESFFLDVVSRRHDEV